MNTYRDRRNKNKGFTLAELLIVVAITIILAAVGFIAIFQYQQNLKFTEMENDAREVFLAAQNSLTSMKENGVDLKDPGEDEITGTLLEKPTDFSKAFEKSGISGTEDEYWTKNQTHFKYISHKAGDPVDDDNGPLLNQILDFGSVDETVRRNGSYIIEYDEETYTVYGVFYSDSNQIEQKHYDLTAKYTYLNANRTNKDNRKNFGKNNDNLGRLTTVGYYGAATDDNIDTEKAKAPKITIYNSGKITYSQEKKGKASTLVSEIIGTQEFQDDKLKYVSAGVQGTLKDTLSLAVKLPNAVDKDDLSRIEVEVSAAGKKKVINYEFSGSSNPSWVNKGKNYYLTLDDIFSANKHFTQQFKGFIPGENISVTVKFIEKNGKESLPKTLPANSLFDSFDKTTGTAEVRSPRQLQNLEPSVSDVANLNSNNNKKKSDEAKLTISNVNVTGDIDWNWNGTGTSGSNEVVTKYNNQKVPVENNSTKYFLSIHNAEIEKLNGQSHTISNLNTVDNAVKIDDNTTHNNAGLFAYTDKDQNLKINDLTLKDINVSVNNGNGSAGSLIGESKGNITVNNVTVDETKTADITAKLTNNNNYGSAGGLIGEAFGNVSVDNAIIQTTGNLNITSKAGDGYSLEKNDSAGSAGGLIGYAATQNISLTNSSVLVTNHNHADNRNNSIVVYGSNRAGGIIGYLNVTGGTINSIQNVQYDGGSYGLVKADDRESGGFIGKLENNGQLSIVNSYSTTYVYTAGRDNHLGRAGGFVGYVDNNNSGTINISRCFYGGRLKDQKDRTTDDDTGYGTDEKAITSDNKKIFKGNYNIVNNGSSIADGNQSAGGFIGTIRGENTSDTGKIEIDQCYTTGSAYVKNGYAGGFLGLSSEEGSNLQIKLTNNYATGIVGTSSENKNNLGSFIGRFEFITNDSTNNHDLGGVNPDLQVAGGDANEVKTQPSDKVISSVYGGTEPFVNNDATVRSYPYADLLKDQSYPFTTVSTDQDNYHIHVGDWPKAPEEDTEFHGDFGIIYYEVVQTGTGEQNKGNRTYYYHGIMADTTKKNTSNNKYRIVKTNDTITSTRPDIDENTGLLKSPSGGDYVVEDGYLILLGADQDPSDYNIGLYSTYNMGATENSSLFKQYNGILDNDKLNISGYNAYFINEDNSLVMDYVLHHTDEGIKCTRASKNNSYASIYCVPYFADEVHLNKASKNHIIRSAHQLKLLFGLPGDSYISDRSNSSNGTDSVLQTMDITFDSNDVDFSTCDLNSGNQIHYVFDDTPELVANQKPRSLTGTYQAANKTVNGISSPYILKHLTRPFTAGNAGTMQNLHIIDLNANSFTGSNSGTIKDVTIENAHITGESEDNLYPSIVLGSNTGTIENLDVYNSEISGNGLVAGDNNYYNNNGIIRNCTLKNVRIGGNGILNTNNGPMSGIQIINAEIKGNGFMNTTFKDVSNCQIINAQIGGSGFLDTAEDGSISNCSIYGDKSKYQESAFYTANKSTMDSAVAENDQLYGYNLVTIGLNPDDGPDNASGDHSGFINHVSESWGGANINNCFVVGKVYGENAYGFIGNVTGGRITINKSYTNTIVYAANTGSGFAGDVSNGNLTIDHSHSLGIINARNGEGFANKTNNNGYLSISNSYSAVWKISGMASGSYQPFSNVFNNNNYVMRFSDGLENYNGWDSVSSAKAVDSDELKNLRGNNDVGGEIKGKTHKYYQYPTQFKYKVAGEYPYPMPLADGLTNGATTLDHYGDWYDPDNQNILANSYKVQFFDENGARISDVLKVNEGSSVPAEDIPDVENDAPKGKNFDGWHLSDGTPITDQLSSVKSNVNAYAHYATVTPYVELHYVSPTDNSIGTLGVAKIINNEVKEPDNIKEFSGYTRVAQWNTSADGKGTSYDVSDGKIQKVASDVKDLYLLYQPKETVNITLEIRADNGTSFPLIYHSYIHEYAKGETYEFGQSLGDFINFANNSSYQIETKEGIKKSSVDDKGIWTLQDVDPSEAAFNEAGNEVTLAGTADDNKTYVVLCTGKQVSYTISHYFYNSKGINGVDSVGPDDLPGDFTRWSNADKLAWINSQMTYSANKNDKFTVVERRTALLGEYIDLEKEALTNSDGSDTGYDVTLNPDNNFVLNYDDQPYSVNYYRKEYNLTIDTNGAEVIPESPVKVHFGENIGADSKYLNGHPQSRTGYTFDKWTYKDTATGDPANTGTDANGATTMPAENITATANWNPNPTASYTVEVWMQKVDANQTPGMDDALKDYDFYDSFSVNNGVVGEMPGFLNDGNAINNLVFSSLQKSQNDLKYFDVNTKNTTNKNKDDNGNDVIIRSDGTTVYRVFYDRKTITFNFNYQGNRISETPVYIYRNNRGNYSLTTQQTNERATSSNTQIKDYITNSWYGSINHGPYVFIGNNPVDSANSYHYVEQKDANGNSIQYLYIKQRGGTPNTESYSKLYGQEFPEAEELFNDYKWQYFSYSNYQNMTLTSLMSYILPGDDSDSGNNGTTLTLTCTGWNNGSAEINHYQEDLDGNWNLVTKTKSSSNSNFSLTNKYDGFKWKGYSYSNNPLPEKINANNVTIKESDTTGGDSGSVLNIFHERKVYNIALMNVSPMKGKLPSGLTIDGNNNITQVKFGQKYGDIELPTSPEIMGKYIPLTVDQNGVIDGYTFGGWYTSATFAPDTEFNPNETMPNHNIRLYAKWIAPQYTVTYKDGDTEIGTEKVDRFGNITLTDDNSIAAKANGYTKPESTFVGWYEDKNLTQEYLPSRPVTKDLTLYAKYDKAPGTNVTYKVQYVYEDGTEAAPTKTVTAEVGKNYEELPLDIPNAISLDVRHSGLVAGDMDGGVITFRYRMYTGSNWTYTVTNHVIYKDLDHKADQEANLSSGSQSTTNSMKLVNAENINGYVIQGDTSKPVKNEEGKKNITFDYTPDYGELKICDASSVYGEFKDPSFTGMDKWIAPEGWEFKTRTTYKDSSDNEVKPEKAGKYKADVSLYLVNGNQSMRLYTRSITYRILKKSIVITSKSNSWPHDGQTHKDPNAVANPEFVNDEEAELKDFATIQEIGSVPNEFTVENSTELKANYNIYREFGTLTITPEGTTNEVANASGGN